MTVFEGATYDESLDYARLSTQIEDVLNSMLDQKWHMMQDIAASINAPEPSVSAQIRNLRKEKHGGYVIDRRRVGNTYEYRLDLTATEAKKENNA
jgi:predicted transcriptional regulator